MKFYFVYFVYYLTDNKHFSTCTKSLCFKNNLTFTIIHMSCGTAGIHISHNEPKQVYNTSQ